MFLALLGGELWEGPLAEFLVLVLILFMFGWGSAFLLPLLRRNWNKLDQTVDNEVIARLLEDTDHLSTRLTQVEDELDFFKKLHEPEEQSRISPPAEDGTGA